MTTGQKVAAGSVVALLLAVGGELLYLHHRNVEDQKTPAQAEYKSDPDDLVFIKAEHPVTLKDEKDLKGRTIWMSAGGQMEYYPFNGHTVEYMHPAGVLLGAEPIQIKDAVEQVVPKSAPVTATFRIPAGDKQILLVFTKPADAKTEFAVPVGYVQGSTYNLLTDQIFFYDDPHQLFSYWGPQVWKAIDAHQPMLGMSERQMQMALGQVSVPHGEKIGDRMVEFDDQGKPKMVTFEGGKATKIVDEQK
jgi:hypothetical protein